MQYSEYLKTSHWQNTRQIKLQERSRCQVCGSVKSLQIHHKRYKTKDRKNSLLFQEKTTDLITTCGSCHRLIHHYFGIYAEKINKKLCRVRRLIELGAITRMAFYFSSQDELFYSVRDELVKMKS